MASISSTGLGSGLNVESMVTQLMAVEKRPLNLLQDANSTLNTKLSAVGKLTSYMSEMRDAASAMSSVLLWKQTTATSSDTAAVGVSVASGASAARFAVEVKSLASVQTFGSAYLTATPPVAPGTLTVNLGTWDEEAKPPSFTSTGSKPIEITQADDTLEKVRDKINAAGAGITASIVNDAKGPRLAIRSATAGAANGFTLTSDDPAMSALTLTDPAQRGLRAADTVATIDGIEVRSTTNKLENVASGVTLTLSKTTSGPVDVSVTPDDEAVTKAVDTFVKAFNQLAGYISEQTKYDADKKKGGTLQGDRATVTLLSQLRGVINEGSTASSVYGRLSDVGLSMGSNGQLTVDSTKLKNALTGKREELRKVFAEDGGTTAGSGFMDRFRDLGNAVLGTEGLLTARSAGIQSQIKQNEKSQDAFESRLALTEARIRRQYQALDTSMSSLSGLSSYVSQQIAAMNKTSG